MNETTDKLIRELSEKLGTTADHLWGVLCRQALISGITNLLVILVWAALTVWGFKFVIRKTITPGATSIYRTAEWSEDESLLAWFAIGVATTSFLLVIGCKLESIIGSLINPEYWALKQILH